MQETYQVPHPVGLLMQHLCKNVHVALTKVLFSNSLALHCLFFTYINHIHFLLTIFLHIVFADLVAFQIDKHKQHLSRLQENRSWWWGGGGGRGLDHNYRIQILSISIYLEINIFLWPPVHRVTNHPSQLGCASAYWPFFKWSYPSMKRMEVVKQDQIKV